MEGLHPPNKKRQRKQVMWFIVPERISACYCSLWLFSMCWLQLTIFCDSLTHHRLSGGLSSIAHVLALKINVTAFCALSSVTIPLLHSITQNLWRVFHSYREICYVTGFEGWGFLFSFAYVLATMFMAINLYVSLIHIGKVICKLAPK